MKRIARVCGVVATLLLAFVGCGVGDDDDGESSESTSTTIDPEVEAEVLAAYEAGWRAFEDAARLPTNPGNEVILGETTSGEALDIATRNLETFAERQVYLDGPPAELHPRVTVIRGDNASIEDCATDLSARYNADGSVDSPANPTPARYEAVMVRVDGVWKTDLITGSEEACEP